MKCARILVSVGTLILAYAGTASTQTTYRFLKQPDGTTFQAVERGDEWLRFYETQEGYIVRPSRDRYFRYFDINARGEFVATDLRVGLDVPRNIQVRPYENPVVRRALQKRIEEYNAAAEANRKRFLQWQRRRLASANVLGKRSTSSPSLSMASDTTLTVGVLLVEFNGQPHDASNYEVGDFENMLFSDDFYHTEDNEVESPDDEDVFGSLRDYFEYQSHGILTITGEVINPDNNGTPVWLNMGNSGPYDTFNESRDLLEDAINVAVNDSSWDCSYSMIAIIVSGDAEDWYGKYGGIAWMQDDFSSGNFPSSPDFEFSDWLGGYIFTERTKDSFSHVGIHCHEMFHVLGWGIPNVIGDGTTIWQHSGSGDWSTMSVGYRAGPLRKTESPGDLDPIARTLMEWADPTDVTSNLDDEPIIYVEEDAELDTTFDFYRLASALSLDEFIIENRQYSGFNSYLPEWWESGTKGGLLVWHHDSSTSVVRSIRRADNDDNRPGTPPLQSDGDLGDPFPGASNNTEITPYTTPNTNEGTITGIAVTDISSSSTTMTADLWAAFPPPTPEGLEITNAGQNGQNPQLSWDANPSTGLDYYAIYHGYQSGGTGPIYWNPNAVATTSNTSWTDNSYTIDTSGGADVLHYRITAVDDNDTESDYSDSVSTGVEEEVPSFKRSPLPREIALRPNYPNPFNPETQIRFELPQAAEVSLVIYNILGEQVRTLANGRTEAGFHSVRWNGNDDHGQTLPSGVYLYRLQVLAEKRRPSGLCAIQQADAVEVSARFLNSDRASSPVRVAPSTAGQAVS